MPSVDEAIRWGSLAHRLEVGLGQLKGIDVIGLSSLTDLFSFVSGLVDVPLNLQKWVLFQQPIIRLQHCSAFQSSARMENLWSDFRTRNADTVSVVEQWTCSSVINNYTTLTIISANNHQKIRFVVPSSP